MDPVDGPILASLLGNCMCHCTHLGGKGIVLRTSSAAALIGFLPLKPVRDMSNWRQRLRTSKHCVCFCFCFF